MLLRYLEQVKVLEATQVKQPNGTYVKDFALLAVYKVQKQTLESEVDAQVYGADIVNMLRITSPYGKLEKFLLTKLNNSKDNISKYYVSINDIMYKIKAVNDFKIDIERL